MEQESWDKLVLDWDNARLSRAQAITHLLRQGRDLAVTQADQLVRQAALEQRVQQAEQRLEGVEYMLGLCGVEVEKLNTQLKALLAGSREQEGESDGSIPLGDTDRTLDG